MKSLFGVAVVFFWLMVMGAGPRAQAQSNDSGHGNQPAAGSQNPSPAQSPGRTDQQNNQNPFPEDTSDVPVIPTHNSSVSIPDEGDASTRIPMPAGDSDPVRSPEDDSAAAENQQQSSSSSLAGMRDLLPPADDEDETEPAKHGRKGRQAEPEHHETAAEDESVGAYYLGNKDWKAALSRFQSAFVLDPDNPDVYWGLAEAERHLGKFADARANYQKVMEYDPGSHHAKEAKKALEDPQIANAKATQLTQTSASPQ